MSRTAGLFDTGDMSLINRLAAIPYTGVVSDILRQLAGLVIPFSLDDARGLASSVGGSVGLEEDLGVVMIEIRKPTGS